MQGVSFNLDTLRIANCGGQHPYNEPDAVRLFGEMVGEQCTTPAPCPLCQKKVTAYFPASQVQVVAGPFFDKYPLKSCHLIGKKFEFSKEEGTFDLYLRSQELENLRNRPSVIQRTSNDENNYLREMGIPIASIFLQGCMVDEEGKKEARAQLTISFSSDESKEQFQLFLLEHAFTVQSSSISLVLQVQGSDFFKLLNIIVGNNSFDNFASLYMRQLSNL